VVGATLLRIRLRRLEHLTYLFPEPTHNVIPAADAG
jgi:hypothetical protein